MLVKNISMLKHLNPGQVHQLMYFIVVSVHDREAELLTGVVVLFRSRKSESDLNIGLVFHSFYISRCVLFTSSVQTFHLQLSSEDVPSIHPSIHATNIFTLPTSDIWFNSNFSQGFFINWNRQFWFFHHSFVYSRFFFPTVAPTLEKNREMTKHDIQVTVAPSNTSEFFFFYFLRVVVYASSKTIFCVVCKVSD